jgi:predicted phosphoribosyltransferase
VVRRLRIPADVVDAVTAVERAELERRERAYRDDRPAPPVRGRLVILVDDGLATGASMRAAVAAVRQLQPARIVVAVPVAAALDLRGVPGRGRPDRLRPHARAVLRRRVVVRDFSQTGDDEVRDLLRQAAEGPPAASAHPEPLPRGPITSGTERGR